MRRRRRNRRSTRSPRCSRARRKAPPPSAQTPHRRGVDREQVAAAALRAARRAAVRDAGAARAVADQPPVRARPRPGPLASIEWLVAQGHDVYCIDWGTPGDEDRYLTLDDIGDRYLGRALRHRRALRPTGDAHVLGYCLGGTLAAIYAAALPERVASLLALAAPVDFDARRHPGDVDAHADVRRRRDRRRVRQRAVAADAGALHMLRPTLASRRPSRCSTARGTTSSSTASSRSRRWGNDNVSFPGACYVRYIEELYRANRLVAGAFTRRAAGPRELSAITLPGARGHVRRRSHRAGAERAAAGRSRRARATSSSLVDRGGHVGAVVSRKAAAAAVARASDVLGAARQIRFPATGSS